MGLFSASSVFDGDVEKATNEKNTAEDWSTIMDICDKIRGSQPNCKEGLKSIVKRLNHADPHVVMQALTLLDACVSNCGKTFHLEIASREFEQEYRKLLQKSQPKIADKLKLLLKKWTESEFKADSQLNLIPSLYGKLKQEGLEFPAVASDLKSSNTQPKDPLSVVSQQEVDDIAKAIELSLKGNKSSSSSPIKSTTHQSLYPSTSNLSSVTTKTSTFSTNPPKEKFVKALYDFEAVEDNELTFYSGEIIEVLDDSDKNWWRGVNHRGEGLFPANFVTSDLTVNSKLNEENEKSIDKETSKKLHVHFEDGETLSNVPNNEPKEPVYIDANKIDRLLHLLHEADTTDETSDSAEMLGLEEEVNAMGPLVDAALEKADMKHAQLTQLSTNLVDAFNLYHSLMREPYHYSSTPHLPANMPTHQGVYNGQPIMGGYEQQYVNGTLPPQTMTLPSHPHVQPSHQYMTMPPNHAIQHVQQIPQQPTEDVIHSHSLPPQSSYPHSIPVTHYNQTFLPANEMVHQVYHPQHLATSLPP